MTEILAALKLLNELVANGKELVKFIEDNKNERWFQDAATAFKEFTQKTPEERRALARDIRDLVNRL